MDRSRDAQQPWPLQDPHAQATICKTWQIHAQSLGRKRNWNRLNASSANAQTGLSSLACMPDHPRKHELRTSMPRFAAKASADHSAVLSNGANCVPAKWVPPKLRWRHRLIAFPAGRHRGRPHRIRRRKRQGYRVSDRPRSSLGPRPVHPASRFHILHDLARSEMCQCRHLEHLMHCTGLTKWILIPLRIRAYLKNFQFR